MTAYFIITGIWLGFVWNINLTCHQPVISISISNSIHTLSVDAFFTLRTLTPLGKWNSWFSKSVLKNVVCVRGSVKDMPTSLVTEVLSFSTLIFVVPCWNTTWNKERVLRACTWSGTFCVLQLVNKFKWTVCISPGYCCRRGPGPGPCGLQLCFCAEGEQCPYLPSAWSATGRSHGTPYCRTHWDQYGSLSILPEWSEG